MDPIPPELPSALPANAATMAPVLAAPEPAGPYALYSPHAVALATLLSAPFAGAWVMALNYRRLGRPAAAWKAILLGILGTGALIGLGFALPRGAPVSGMTFDAAIDKLRGPVNSKVAVTIARGEKKFAARSRSFRKQSALASSHSTRLRPTTLGY